MCLIDTSLQITKAYGIYAHNRAHYPGRGRQEDDSKLDPQEPHWELSLMSVPPGGKWNDYFEPKDKPENFTFEADNTYGRGQIIYMIEDDINLDHQVYLRLTSSPWPVSLFRTAFLHFLLSSFPPPNC